MITGQLGTPRSAPGSVQPGYFCTGTIVWKGQPFDPALASLGSTVAQTIAKYGRATVPSAVASQIALSDPDWWDFH